MAWEEEEEEAAAAAAEEVEVEEGGVADGRKGADGERLISGGRSDGCPV